MTLPLQFLAVPPLNLTQKLAAYTPGTGPAHLMSQTTDTF